MSQPPGFLNEVHLDVVCKLHKFLYGLKQAPCAWFERLSSFLISLSFSDSKNDSSLFIYFFEGTFVYLPFYVHDILITSNTPTIVH